jgi:hypothetical protein
VWTHNANCLPSPPLELRVSLLSLFLSCSEILGVRFFQSRTPDHFRSLRLHQTQKSAFLLARSTPFFPFPSRACLFIALIRRLLRHRKSIGFNCPAGALREEKEWAFQIFMARGMCCYYVHKVHARSCSFRATVDRFVPDCCWLAGRSYFLL